MLAGREGEVVCLEEFSSEFWCGSYNARDRTKAEID